MPRVLGHWVHWERKQLVGALSPLTTKDYIRAEGDFHEEIIIIIIIIIIIYPLTTRVVGAPQVISQAVSSIFPCSPLPSGTCQTPGLSIP